MLIFGGARWCDRSNWGQRASKWNPPRWRNRTMGEGHRHGFAISVDPAVGLYDIGATRMYELLSKWNRGT
jgi:hypothetical protein